MADYQDRMRERIVQAREEKGYSPEELALRAGLSARQVRRIEAGKSRNPHMSTVRAIADATGKDVTWIRPDLEAEEAELQQQLDSIEEKVDEILAILKRGEVGEALEGILGAPLSEGQLRGGDSEEVVPPRRAKGQTK